MEENTATDGGLFSNKITEDPQHWQRTYPGTQGQGLTFKHKVCHWQRAMIANIANKSQQI